MARTPAIGRKRVSAKQAKAKATSLHSRIVRARGACENCGRTENLQCAHVVSRRYAQTRTRLDNAFCLCAGCHMHFTEWPLSFATFVEQQIGIAHYQKLQLLSQEMKKVDWSAEVDRLTLVLKQVEVAQ